MPGTTPMGNPRPPSPTDRGSKMVSGDPLDRRPRTEGMRVRYGVPPSPVEILISIVNVEILTASINLNFPTTHAFTPFGALRLKMSDKLLQISSKERCRRLSVFDTKYKMCHSIFCRILRLLGHGSGKCFKTRIHLQRSVPIQPKGL